MRRWFVRVALVCVASPVVASLAQSQGAPFAIDQVEMLVRGGTSMTRIKTLIGDNCVDFPVDDESRSRLRNARAAPELLTALANTCYRGSIVRVQTTPAGAEITLNGRVVGHSPWRGPVRPTRGIVIVARLPSGSKTVTADVPQHHLLSVTISLPTDTEAVPDVPTRLEIATRNALLAAWHPSQPEPVAPKALGAPHTFGAIALGAVLGGAAGAGVGLLGCPAAKTTYVGDQPSTTSGYRTCVGAAAAVGAVSASLISALISHSHHHSVVQTYEQQKQAFDAADAVWRRRADSERVIFVQSDPKITAKLEEAQRAHHDALTRNASANQRNAALPAPEIEVREGERLDSALGTP